MIGIVTYLSGPASVFGAPGKRTAEMLFDQINAAGVPTRPVFITESSPALFQPPVDQTSVIERREIAPA